MSLGERDEAAIREAFDDLEQDVEVTLELGPSATSVTLLAAGGRELDTNAITLGLVEEVCGLGDRVQLEVVEHEQAGQWPRTTIAGTSGTGLVYLGMPAGYELTTLVGAIVESGRAESTLTATTLDRLATLERDVTIDVFVTPT